MKDATWRSSLDSVGEIEARGLEREWKLLRIWQGKSLMSGLPFGFLRLRFKGSWGYGGVLLSCVSLRLEGSGVCKAIIATIDPSKIEGTRQWQKEGPMRDVVRWVR